MNLRARFLSIVIAVSLAVGISGMAMANPSNVNLKASSPTVGALAPNFTLRDLDGRSVSLSDLRGKIVVMDFWASWCPPCRMSMPKLESLHQEFKNQNVVVLSINIEETREEIRWFLEQNGFTFKTLSDADGTVADLYGVRSIPTMFVIGRDGRIVATHVGLQSEATLRSDLIKAGVRQGGGDSW